MERTHIALPEYPIQILEPTSDDSQMPLTPTPKEFNSDHHRHLHSHAPYTQTHINNEWRERESERNSQPYKNQNHSS